MINQFIYDVAVWLDGTAWSTGLHESYYMYNWIETTHVLTLVVSLGLLFLIDLRMLGLALVETPASQLAARLKWPMLIGFGLMFITGFLLFYAIPVRSSQSLWLRIKLVLLVCAGINAWLFHRQMQQQSEGWENDRSAPRPLKIGAAISLAIWASVVVCGRFIAYNWFDCEQSPSPIIATLSGCLAEQAYY